MSLETAFLTCLKEIEVSYISLPKAIRLRIERWVEKLVVVGQNILWKKHRNMYARLLLGMILSKNFTDPFDVNPSDGPLPPFPSHLKVKLKSISGPHESSFWRDIYHKIPPTHEKITSPQNFISSSNVESDWRYDMGRNEIDSLRQLIQEQSRRIELLEAQLASERLNHESEIIRFMEHHRGEINALRKKSERAVSASSDHQHRVLSNSSLSPPRSHRSSKFSSSLQSPQRDYDLGSTRRSFETERLHPPTASSTSSPTSYSSSFDITNTRPPSFAKRKTQFPSQQNSSFLLTSPNNSPYTADIREEGVEVAEDEEEKVSEEEFYERDLYSERSQPQMERNVTKNENVEKHDSIPEEDSEFLRYLENFQSELRAFH